MEENKTIHYCSMPKFLRLYRFQNLRLHWEIENQKFWSLIGSLTQSLCFGFGTWSETKCYILIAWVKRRAQAVTFRWQRFTPQRLTEHLATVNLPQSMYIGPISVRFWTTHLYLVSGTKGTPGSDRLRNTFGFASHAVLRKWSQSTGLFKMIVGDLTTCHTQ